MDHTYINITRENIDTEHLCCIIRTKKTHDGIEAKRTWLANRIDEGHVFRKLDVKGCVFIEYAPLEKAWVPITGNNFFYLYCLWNDTLKGQGYGSELMQYCIEDAKAKGKSGICMLGAKKQKHWLADQLFAKKFGFEVVDSTQNGYDLLALSFDGSKPQFTLSAKEEQIQSKELTIYYDNQCPFVYKSIELVKKYCELNTIPVHINTISSLEQAKELPCVFNNWAVFYDGRFITVNLLNDISKIIKKTT
jgi:N-acetylglutamate synthase-like GNAT family acetyltransferase